MNIICVYRASCFSPNMEENDASIMNAVAERLQAGGHHVRRIHEEQLSDIAPIIPDMIYTMGRLDHTLDVLQQLEMQGVTVINSSIGIRNCDRKRFTQILMDEDVPFAESKILSPLTFTHLPSLLGGVGGRLSPLTSHLSYPVWLKKGEGYTEVAEDVMFIQNDQELQDGIAQMNHRGIQTVVVSQHLEGDLVKCYGVKDSQFFYWSYSSKGHSKFGLEAINGKNHGYPFSEKQLRAICNQAANVIGVDVYGADCVIGENGTIHIIDMNDWPSFSCCRNQAAEMIANRYLSQNE